MTYDVDTPTSRYNTDVTREYYRKYRPESEEKSLLRRYSPLDNPDSDIVLKTRSGLVYGAVAGLTNATYGVIQYSKPSFTYAGIASKSFRYGTPWLIAGASYGVTLSLVTQIRKKESPAHHMLAGYAAGTMFGSWYKSPIMGVWFGAITGIVAGLCKFWHDNDMLEPRLLRRQRVFNFYRRGWFTEKPNPEGRNDAEIDVSFNPYRP